MKPVILNFFLHSFRFVVYADTHETFHVYENISAAVWNKCRRWGI